MLSGFASNAVLAKARAMYGRRLTRKNYADLLACKNVEEVAAYLKGHTAYGKVLSELSGNAVHRRQLESKLKQKLFEDYAALCRYEISVGEHFAQYLIIRSETEQILHSILLLEAGMPEEYLFVMPAYLNRHTRIDLPSLSRIQSYGGLLDALSHTPYRALLEPFRPVKGVPLNYTAIENALFSYLLSTLFNTIGKYTHGETAKQLKQIFLSYADLVNYARILRLKLSYGAGSDLIRSSLLPFGTLRPRLLTEMIHADSPEAAAAVMKTTSIGKRFLDIAHTYADADEIPNRMLYRTGRHGIYFSTRPPVVMLSYIFVMQAELTDIVTIVEGIRYGLSPDEISGLLTVYQLSKGE